MGNGQILATLTSKFKMIYHLIELLEISVVDMLEDEGWGSSAIIQKRFSLSLMVRQNKLECFSLANFRRLN